MQYFGYLRRNPNDPPEPGLNFEGYNFWLNKLNQFNGDYIGADMVKGLYRFRGIQAEVRTVTLDMRVLTGLLENKLEAELELATVL